MTPEQNNQVYEILRRYCRHVENGVEERWSSLTPELYDPTEQEVVGGLLARQATLSTELAMAPSICNGHIAPLILRAMIDVHITLAWILRDAKKRAREFVFFGIGQEKLLIEHLEAKLKETPQDTELQQLVTLKQTWLFDQRAHYLIEVDVGSWGGKSVRQMAKEADCEELYKFAYLPFSGAAHSMWQHVAIYNLRHCLNPLHKFHRVPTIRQESPQLDYVVKTAKYLTRSLDVFDETYSLSISSEVPYDWLNRELSALRSDPAKEPSESATPPDAP